jgi:hypothetical protein
MTVEGRRPVRIRAIVHGTMPALVPRMVSRAVTVASLAVVALLGAACSAANSSGEPPDSGEDAGVDSGADGDDASADAVADSATADVDATPDGGCALDLGADASACDSCKAQKCCATTSAQSAKPGSWTDSAALVCAENECATECSLTAPQCGGITPDPATCLAALDAMCCDLVTACGQSDACVAVIYLCIDDQGNDPGSTGFDACAAKYPGGLAVFDNLNACFSTVSCP